MQLSASYEKLLDVFPSCDKLTIRQCMHGKKPCRAGLCHQADRLKNSKLRRTSHWITLKPEAERALNKLPKSVITSQRNHQSWKGFPSDITQQPTADGGFDRPPRNTRVNTRSAVKLNWKQVNQTNLYCCWKLVNWSVCSKASEVSACALPQWSYEIAKECHDVIFFNRKILTCVCVCVCARMFLRMCV